MVVGPSFTILREFKTEHSKKKKKIQYLLKEHKSIIYPRPCIFSENWCSLNLEHKNKKIIILSCML